MCGSGEERGRGNYSQNVIYEKCIHLKDILNCLQSRALKCVYAVHPSSYPFLFLKSDDIQAHCSSENG